MAEAEAEVAVGSSCYRANLVANLVDNNHHGRGALIHGRGALSHGRGVHRDNVVFLPHDVRGPLGDPRGGPRGGLRLHVYRAVRPLEYM